MASHPQSAPQQLPKKPPSWAVRGSRAVPHLTVPTLSDLGASNLLANQGRLAATFIGRIAVGLALFAACMQRGWYIGLVASTFVIYGGSITAVHHLIHGSLGFSPTARRFWLSVLAAVVTESGHALQATHLTHHRTDPNAPDPEGYIEYVSWKQMTMEVFRFRYRLMAWGLRNSSTAHRVRHEIAFHIAVHVAAVAALPLTKWPAVYLLSMMGGSAVFTVLSGKGPQTNFGRPIDSPFIEVRTNWFGRAVLFSHDRHLEHHLYPKVPLPRLRHLDRSLQLVLDRTHHIEVTLP